MLVQLTFAFTTVAPYTPMVFLGLLFALLLKREDKKGGFGVDLPLNKK